MGPGWWPNMISTIFHPSESDPRLELHDPACKTGCRLAKICIGNSYRRTTECKRRQVELVEDIKKVRSQFQIGAFVERANFRKRNEIHQAHVGGKVTRPTKSMASNSGRPVRNQRKKAPSVRPKDPVHDEVFVRGWQITRPAITLRTRRTESWTTRSTGARTAGWRERKAGMVGDNSGDLKSPKRPAYEVAPVFEERQFIESRQIEIVPDVKVGGPTFGTVVLGKGLVRNKPRTFVRQLVNALTPAVVRLQLQTIVITPSQVDVQGVVVRVDVRCREEDLEETRIVGKEKVLIHEPD